MALASEFLPERVCGFINGIVTTKLKLQPFIVTLGTMSAFRGISYVMNDGQPYNVPAYTYLGEGRIAAVPVSILIAAIIILLAILALRYTPLGRYTYAIGSNREAAFHSGVNVNRNLTVIYTLAGLLVGVAAMIATSRTISAQPTAGIGLELDIIAAVVIGGREFEWRTRHHHWHHRRHLAHQFSAQRLHVAWHFHQRATHRHRRDYHCGRRRGSGGPRPSEVNGFACGSGFCARLAFVPRLRDTRSVQRTVTQLTEQLVASYARAGGINHLDGKNLPSKRAITIITIDLLRLLFPGYFDEKLIHSSEIKVETAALLDTVLGSLEDEVYKSLEYHPPEGLAKRDLRSTAHELTMEFLGNLPHVRELLQTDTEAAYNGDPAALSKEEVIVAYPFIEAIAVQRLAHELYKKDVPLIPRIMTEWAHGRTGMDLHPGAQIGTHFFVDHCTGTVIGETSEIGNHVKMYQGVGLVAKSLAAGQALRGQKRHPTIENHVTIYAGATIMGGDTVVGEGSTIGANVFLTTSVPPNSIVVQEDANVKVMSKRDRENKHADFQI